MPSERRRTFPLVPRRRLIGLPFGEAPSRRRGHGSDVIGHRLYEPGDPIASIDWFASARRSAVTGGDEFVVRERSVDEAPRVVLVLDRRPAMDLHAGSFPWLDKRRALGECAAAIATSAAAARADLAALDFATGEAAWIPPSRRDRAPLVAERHLEAPFGAPDDVLDRSLLFLLEHRSSLPPGSFVFVLSDFLAPPSPALLLRTAGHGLDVVPVLIQDPVWERSFPEVAGVAVPIAEPRSGSVSLVRLGRGQAARRREANARRFAATVESFGALGMRVVVVSSAEQHDVEEAFLAWSEERRRTRWAR